MTLTRPEEAERFQELADTLEEVLAENTALRGEHRVEPEDLALYLEWLVLAREAAGSPEPFVARSAPYLLSTLSYRELESDFHWLQRRVDAG